MAANKRGWRYTTFFTALAVAAATVVGAPRPALAGHDGYCDVAAEDGNLCLYRDSDYTGGMLDFTRTDHNYTSSADVFWIDFSESGININDQVSSIVNAETRCVWYLYRDIEFGGGGFWLPIGTNISNLALVSGNYNDAISSHYKWTGTKECTNGSTGQ
ncbi:peptidase inhibitor family I36 protein [Microbispora catharanthi]|uniref:Peptidase inhibitor family I36 protein n=1 Tax=Microbispora catharanthi TaxID=1712871 RepID=A0A5N6BLS5_9ACTN|nr:peptidase inhibitor family I36 protein [Microbispora catharanthi]KAB8180779.1 hypothetical protein FH610_031385 [Microbispora catharanthi]